MGIAKLMKLISKIKNVTNEIRGAVKTGEVCAMLDYPQKGKKITAPYYTFRIGTLGDIERVEISINQSSWQPCRYSAGYWWYDWSGYTEGRYQVVAKVWTKDNRTIICKPCKFKVVLETDGK